MSEFDDALAALSPPSTAEGGIIPVLIRVATHLGYLIAHISDQGHPEGIVLAERTVSDDNDITDLINHANHLTATSDNLSRASNTQLIRLNRLIHAIGTDWTSLTDEERIARASDTADRVAAVGSTLDIELAGIASGAGAHV